MAPDPPMLEIAVQNDQQKHTFRQASGSVLFGRAPAGTGRHFVVRDAHVSRSQLRIELQEDDQLRIENVGSAPVQVDGRGALASGATELLSLPVNMVIGKTEISVRKGQAQKVATTQAMRTIARPTQVRLPADASSVRVAEWFEGLLSVQKAAAGSAAFYDETARAVVDLIGLDRGLVLLATTEGFEVAAVYPPAAPRYSRTVLEEVVKTGRTAYEMPDAQVQSLQQVDAFVASPILGPKGDVAGVLFGSRDRRTELVMPAVEPLEAQVVQALAAAASAGLARVEKEQEAIRLRTQFERVFSPELVSELEKNPRMLDPTTRVITVLFTDLRGFSRLSEQLAPEETFRLVSEVMDFLTERVLAEKGVIIDYYGDGMAAMWNAPLEQPDHADRACRAALQMQADLHLLQSRWPDLPAPIRVGAGIHTGPALVGNAGSEKRQKYGPRGHTVNVASRVEGATKQAGVPILISDATAGAAGPLETRRIGPVGLVGVDGAVGLRELRVLPETGWAELRTRYESALDLFLDGQAEAAAAALAPLPPEDGPTRLLRRSLDALTRDPTVARRIQLTAK